ncbi:hypothetical protein ACIPSA_40930 [Streptomyces sp. NPDC086549]|uniref:hypothetical protein n=1 Tax=Streptomyces sp. NPDC086549 TaxID=3365752 RepID=UPI003809E702
MEVPATTAVHLTSGVGDIMVHRLSGTTYAKSGTGSVDIGDSSAKSVTAADVAGAGAGDGDVTVSFKSVPDKADAGTEGGDATVRLPQGAYDWTPPRRAVTGRWT